MFDPIASDAVDQFTRCRFPAGPPSNCPICNEVARHHHFGGNVNCDGCASFFRRTIVEQKSYKCRKQGNCTLRKVRGRTICRFCRFQRCLAIGMVMKAVEPKRPQNSYQPLTSLFKSNFITRYKATIDVYGGQQNFKNMSNTIKTADSMLKANSAEIHVLSDFLFNSELITNDDKQSGFASQMIQSSLLTWITVESLYTNIKHLSFRSNRCYFLDDSFIPVNEDQILSYYRGYSLLFPEEVTRHAIVFYKQVRDLAAKMYAHKVDEMEMAVFSLILILKHAISLNNNNVEKYQRKLNELFKQLQHHYKHNYDDLPIRLGNLILFLDELRDVSKTRDEMIILMRLHDLQDLGTHNLLWENSKPPTQQFICR